MESSEASNISIETLRYLIIDADRRIASNPRDENYADQQRAKIAEWQALLEQKLAEQEA